MKQLNYFARLLLDWLMVAMGVLGSLFCLITAFDFPVPDGIVIAVLLATGFDCLLLSGRKLSRISAPILLTLLVFFAYLFRRELAESFRNLWGELISSYAKGYDQLRDLVPREPTDPAAIGQALSFLGLVMALPVSCAVRWWKRSFPAALALLPGIVPCFILTDTPPALLPLLAAAASILIQIYSQTVRRREAGEEGKAIVLATAMSALVLSLLLLLFPQEGYSPPISWSQLTEKLSRWGVEQGNRGNQRAGLSGNPEQVDLSALGALPVHPVTVLRVRAEKSGNIYLRGSSYVGFDGASWTRGEKRDWPANALFPYLDSDEGYQIEIESLEKEPLLYVSYQPTTLPETGRLISDAYIDNPEECTRYSFSCTERWYLRDPTADYDSWVRESCTELPETTRRGVLDWWEQTSGWKATIAKPYAYKKEDQMMVSYEFDDVARMEEFAKFVTDQVSRSARYSRNPLQAPDGVDFCTWFLNEAEEGYCVHFATACTALLRALNVPARYVSGYVCPAEENKTVSVTNLHAHAWVEIWAGGHWVPVEPTPDYATEFTGRISEASVPDTPTVTEEPTESSSIPPTGEVRPPMPSYTRPIYTRPTFDPLERPDGPGTEPELPANRSLTLLWVFLGVIGTLLLLLARRELAERLRVRKLTRASANDRARLLYRYIRRLYRLGGDAVPEKALHLAHKASFSQYEMSEEELIYLQKLYVLQINRLQSASLPRRFYCKYVLAVV